MKKINWTNHLIELVVVIIGITIAFLLNSWRESRAEDQLALKYYNSLLKDLTVDADNLDELLTFSESQDSILSDFVDKSREGIFPANELPTVLQVLVSFNPFATEIGTYETIKFSGNLNVFSDYQLREEINAYYNRMDEIMIQQELQLDYMNNYCIPFIYKNFNILSGELLPEAELDVEMSNVIVGFYILLQQNLKSYKNLMEENMGLKLKLAQKLSD